MNIFIVGLGLMGGSLGLALRSLPWVETVSGCDQSDVNARVARKLKLVDRTCAFTEGVDWADLIVLAVPVDVIEELLPQILERLRPDQIVTDLGSTKYNLTTAARTTRNRGRYVAAHPMVGTEHSGPQAAFADLYRGGLTIICDPEDSDPDALVLTEKLFRDLGMRTKSMPADRHDLHAAYVSHVSHISSFVLAQTVLDQENKSRQAIFDMAAAGFASTVRLAKSSPEMWSPIFLQNADFLVEVLDVYIENMRNFRNEIENRNASSLQELMREANAIRQILK